jgi:hypothetical protein
MSRISLAKDAQLRETLISGDRGGGENLAPLPSKSWWRSSSGGALAAAAATGGPLKKERIGGEIVFDPFSDMRPLNYK